MYFHFESVGTKDHQWYAFLPIESSFFQVDGGGCAEADDLVGLGVDVEDEPGEPGQGIVVMMGDGDLRFAAGDESGDVILLGQSSVVSSSMSSSK